MLEKLRARTRSALDAAIAVAMGTISPDDASSWFKHCGYAAQAN